jgi:MFS family permease
LGSLTREQWLVFFIAAAAWFFDCLDQRLFSLVRVNALADLMGLPAADLAVQNAAKVNTATLLLGWGIGGLVSGTLGDRLGRARILILSTFLFSLGSGLTVFSATTLDFAVLRFVTGIGMGGIFGLGVALISDSVRGEVRLLLLAAFQIATTVANMLAAFVKMGVERAAQTGLFADIETWRLLFAISGLPALVGVAGLIWLREPQAWRDRKARGELPPGLFGGYAMLLRDAGERRNLIIGTALAVSGVVGLWGIGEYATDLQTTLFTAFYREQGAADVALRVADARNWAYLLQMAGAAAGMAAFGWSANRFGRRPTFIVWFIATFAITLGVHWWIETPLDAYWMMPLMGAAQFGLFAGFTIYLPELFGPSARGTGVSFAYNAGRFAAAAGGLGSAWLSGVAYSGLPAPMPLRLAAITMCGIFIIGIVASMLAPETKGAEHRQ